MVGRLKARQSGHTPLGNRLIEMHEGRLGLGGGGGEEGGREGGVEGGGDIDISGRGGREGERGGEKEGGGGEEGQSKRYPLVSDFRKAVEQMDKQQILSLSESVMGIRNSYLLIHDKITKNQDRLKQASKPERHSSHMVC
ncbi:hypothetical protein VYU27_007744 [Nannochloropsis oceanica]